MSEYDYGSGVNIGDGARWAFFAIFIVLIIVMVLGTIRLNRKRARQGVAPIYGTLWMTPPLYRQSQTQYNQPNRADPEMPLAYVPKYTAETTDVDMGYYDVNGKFHANPHASMPYPTAHHHQQLALDGIPLQNLNEDISDEDLYRRHPPTSRGDRDSLDSLGPPPGPPPETAERGVVTVVETEEVEVAPRTNHTDSRT